jgi:hypothetical protein
LNSTTSFKLSILEDINSKRWLLSTYRRLREHMIKFVRSPHVCSICFANFQAKSLLMKHKLAAHVEDRLEYACKVCQFVGSLRNFLSHHCRK